MCFQHSLSLSLSLSLLKHRHARTQRQLEIKLPPSLLLLLNTRCDAMRDACAYVCAHASVLNKSVSRFARVVKFLKNAQELPLLRFLKKKKNGHQKKRFCRVMSEIRQKI